VGHSTSKGVVNMIEVYHWTLREPALRRAHGFLLDADQSRLVMQGRDPHMTYEQVALVDTEDLNKAFELTNNIDSSWTRNPGLVTDKEACRSTSTGDVLKINGKYYLVASIGFKQLDM